MTTRSNVPEFSVTDLAFSLKKTVEGAYSHVRVRGELSRVSIAASGHMYSSLKDDGAVIDAVCWKGVMNKLSVRPEEGLEVICTGSLSTFPKRSNYQLVIQSMELAGEGALLKMLEQRKKKLAAEGLFDQQRKKRIPRLPKVIGVVTSPTGAVIRDILHRLSDRMPSHVIVWPALVQGDGAAAQVARGIEGLQDLKRHGLPEPDVIIVARGGGSLEDLMAFNEEEVVRTAAACRIPLISAVGHETDTTLIDYASDLRAPTPTGAAEMAVPVRGELLAMLAEGESRLVHAMSRQLEDKQARLEIQARSLPDPMRVLEMKEQALDHLSQSLDHKMAAIITQYEGRAMQASARLRHPRDVIDQKAALLDRWADQLDGTKARLFEKAEVRLAHADKMLEAYSFQNVLKRGYTVIHGSDGRLIPDYDSAQSQSGLEIEFYGGKTLAVRTGDDQPKTPPEPPKKRKKPAVKTDNLEQDSLF